MGKKGKSAHLKKKMKTTEDFGTCPFYCKHCNHHFEVEWQTIWDIQEITHGFVGFHTNDTLISCPKCEKIVGDEDEDNDFMNDLLFKDARTEEPFS